MVAARHFHGLAAMLDGLASIAAGLGHFDLAARLCGAAAGWRETYQEESWDPMPNDFDESAANVRRRLGERAWMEAYEAGRKLNSEGAMTMPACRCRTTKSWSISPITRRAGSGLPI